MIYTDLHFKMLKFKALKDNTCVFKSNKKVFLSYESKKGGKDQESIQSSITSDPRYHMGK